MVRQNRLAKSASGCLGCLLILCAAVLPLASTYAGPITITFTGSLSNRGASVSFEQIGKKLKVTLINTASADVLDAPDVLTAVFFSIAGDPKLKPTSATVPIDNDVLFGTTGKKGAVGGEWAYRNQLPNAPADAHEGISSASFNLFDSKNNRFKGKNLQGLLSPGGLEYGLTSTNDNPSSPIGPPFIVTSDNALVKNTVVLMLKGLPKGFVLQPGMITDVGFQYGTALVDPYVPSQYENGQLIPEPSSFALAGAGLLLAALLVRKRR